MKRDPSTDTRLPPELEERFYELWFAESSAARPTAVDELCAAHPEYASELRALVRSLERSEGVLGRITEPAAEPAHPENIGPYVVQEPIGSGGFGVVYRAEQQQPVQRTVAIKILRDVRLDAQGMSRFKNEQQALAVMDHPSIASVFDAGQTDTGRPYFVMEFVDGEPITKYCDIANSTISHRLNLFLKVCGAIDHAHRKGVVHRDLKPANVLVSTTAEGPLPRVIDFGIAKVLSDEVRRENYDTLEGALVGTPEYMSPEQAQSRPIDVRSDIYALGVMLYELLTGELPFSRERLGASSVVEIARIVCEEEPRRPGTVLGSLDAERASSIATRRGLNVRQLEATLRSDVQWILTRCLEKDPDRRYGSAGELAADIGRYLTHLPVLARQPTYRYLMGKFVRRHRIGVGVASFVATVCLLGVVGLVWALVSVDDARVREVEQRGAAELQSYAANLGAAKLAVDAGAIGNAQRHLEAATSKWRGWEWRHVQASCNGGSPRLEVGPSCDLVDWLTDDELLIADRTGYDGGDGFPVEIRSLSRSQTVRTFACEGVLDFWVDPRRERLVTLSPAGIEVWQTDTASRIATLAAPADRDPLTMAITGDRAEGVLYFANRDGVVFRAELSDLEAVTEFARTSERLSRLATAGSTVFAGLARGGILAMRSGTAPRRIGPDDPARFLLANRDGSTLFAATRAGVVVIDTASGTSLRTLTGVTRQQTVHSLALSPDESRLFVASGWAEGSAVAFDTENWTVTDEYRGHTLGVHGVAASPDGSRIATASRDRTVRIWPRRTVPVSGQVAAGTDARVLAWSPDRRRIAAAAMDGSYRVWRTTDMKELAAGRIGEPLYCCAMTGDRLYAMGRRLYGFDATGNAVIDEAVAQQVAPEWRQSEPIARHMVVDPQEQWLACLSYDRLYVWALPLGQAPWRHDSLCKIHCLAYDAATARLAMGCADGLVRFFDPKTQQLVETLSGLGPATRREVDPDAIGNLPIYQITFSGQRIATASADGRVRVLDRSTTEPVMVLHGHEIIGTGVSFSPDGSRIVSSGGDGYVRLWEADSGVPLLSLRDRFEVCRDVAFSPDGTRIFALSHKWRAPSFVQWWYAPAGE